MSLAGRGTTLASTLTSQDRDHDPDDAVWIAQRMVLDAGAEAARLRRQASARAAAVREAAERESGIIWQQASAQAAAIREAAEREAERLRDTVMKLSAAPDEARPRVAGPGEARAARGQKGPPPRQLVAVRVAAAATAVLCLFALAAGTTELVLHGFAFFVFRAAGTGETSKNGLQEDQGPGQPGAPKPAPSHIKVQLNGSQGG